MRRDRDRGDEPRQSREEYEADRCAPSARAMRPRARPHPDAAAALACLLSSARKRAEKREAEARARELEALDRDVRTVFAYNVNTKADERDLFEFFSAAGKVLDVRIIYDRNTPRSKGMAYIELARREDVPAALALTGSTLRGQVVMVKASEAEKNIAWEAEKAQKAAGLPPLPMQLHMGMIPGTGLPGAVPGVESLLGGAGPAKLRVSGLHAALSASDVRAVFEPFGALASCDLAPGAPGEADVVFATARDAVQAAAQLNGLDLAGSAIKVVLASGGAPQAMPGGALPPPPPLLPGMLPPGMVLPPGAALPPGMMFPGMPAAAAAAPAAAESLDDDGDTGLKLDSRSRAALMARLSGQDASAAAPAVGINPLTGMPMAPGSAAAPGGAAALPAALQPTTQGRLGPPSPIPTDCILLKNMFDPATESEPDWWIDIGEDVKEECTKYGPVRHVFVDKDSSGFVYLRFGSVAAASAARAALHTRWFASRMIAAEFQFTAVYERHFPESAQAA